jgi:hypothetical protein
VVVRNMDPCGSRDGKWCRLHGCQVRNMDPRGKGIVDSNISSPTPMVLGIVRGISPPPKVLGIEMVRFSFSLIV